MLPAALASGQRCVLTQIGRGPRPDGGLSEPEGAGTQQRPTQGQGDGLFLADDDVAAGHLEQAGGLGEPCRCRRQSGRQSASADSRCSARRLVRSVLSLLGEKATAVWSLAVGGWVAGLSRRRLVMPHARVLGKPPPVPRLTTWLLRNLYEPLALTPLRLPVT